MSSLRKLAILAVFGITAIAVLLVAAPWADAQNAPTRKLFMVGAGDDAIFEVDTDDGTLSTIGSPFKATENSPSGIEWMAGKLWMLGAQHDKLYTLSTSTGDATAIGSTFSGTDSSPGDLFAHKGVLYMLDRNATLGLYHVSTSTGQLTDACASVTPAIFYATDNDDSSSLVKRNAATNVYTVVGSPSLIRIRGITIHDGLLYGTTNAGQLFTLSTSTGFATTIGSTKSNKNIVGMTSDSGTLYVADTHGNRLYIVDTSDGTYAQVGSSSFSEDVPEGLASHKGIMYMVGSGKLYTVSTSTGVITHVGTNSMLGSNTRGMSSDGDNLYALNVSNGNIYSINTDTAAAVDTGYDIGLTNRWGFTVTPGLITKLGVTPHAATSMDGKVYVTASGRQLKTLDINACEVADIGTWSGGENAAYGLAGIDGTLYMTGYNYDRLYSLSTTTGALTTISSSSWSSIESIAYGLTFERVAPSAPSDVSSSYDTASNLVSWTWTLPYDGGSHVRRYGVNYRKYGTSNWTKVNTPSTSISITPNSGALYEFEVRADSDEGFSPWSTLTYGAAAYSNSELAALPFVQNTPTAALLVALVGTDNQGYRWLMTPTPYATLRLHTETTIGWKVEFFSNPGDSTPAATVYAPGNGSQVVCGTGTFVHADDSDICAGGDITLDDIGTGSHLRLSAYAERNGDSYRAVSTRTVDINLRELGLSAHEAYFTHNIPTVTHRYSHGVLTLFINPVPGTQTSEILLNDLTPLKSEPTPASTSTRPLYSVQYTKGTDFDVATSTQFITYQVRGAVEATSTDVVIHVSDTEEYQLAMGSRAYTPFNSKVYVELNPVVSVDVPATALTPQPGDPRIDQTIDEFVDTTGAEVNRDALKVAALVAASVAVFGFVSVVSTSGTGGGRVDTLGMFVGALLGAATWIILGLVLFGISIFVIAPPMVLVLILGSVTLIRGLR